MYEIYKMAMDFAKEQKAIIIKLDIHFNYITESYIGHLLLSNGNKYTLIEGKE